MKVVFTKHNFHLFFQILKKKDGFHIKVFEILKKHMEIVFCKYDFHLKYCLKVVFSKEDFQLNSGNKTQPHQHIINAKVIKTCH